MSLRTASFAIDAVRSSPASYINEVISEVCQHRQLMEDQQGLERHQGINQVTHSDILIYTEIKVHDKNNQRYTGH